MQKEDERLAKISKPNNAFELIYTSTLKMERNYFSETFEPIYRIAQLHFPEDSDLHIQNR
jgi:hypothetical protein